MKPEDLFRADQHGKLSHTSSDRLLKELEHSEEKNFIEKSIREAQKKNILSICQKNEINLYQMEKKKDKYEIRANDVFLLKKIVI